MKRSIHSRTHAFTLVELLVVISVIAILIAMLLPALGTAREHAKRTACASNQRGVGQLMHYYANDFQDYLTAAFNQKIYTSSAGAFWFQLLCKNYLDTPQVGPGMYDRVGDGRGKEKIFICPVEPTQGGAGLTASAGIGYGINYIGVGGDNTLISAGATTRIGSVDRPGETILATDSTIYWNAYITTPKWWGPIGEYVDNNPQYRHDTNANFLFVDGRVAALGPETTLNTDTLWRVHKNN